MNKANHILNRISLVGIGGGIALIAALYYPLYVLLPSQYLADWQTGSSLIGVILLLLAPLLAVGTGYLAARQAEGKTRRSNLLWGALAGGVAGSIFFYGLGGAAAGVVGSRTILAHGLVPAESESHFLWLLAESVTSTISWVYGMLWVTVLAGIALGATGGLLAPLALAAREARKEARKTDWLLVGGIVQAAVLATTLSLVVTVAIFTVLGPQVEEAAAEFQADGFLLSLSPDWIPFWTLASAQALYLLSLGAFYLSIDKALKSQELTQVSVVSAYFGAFPAAFLPLLLILMIGSGISFTIAIVGLTINLLLVILLLRSANASASHLPIELLPTRIKWAEWLQRSLIPTVILSFILSLVGASAISWLLLLVVITTFAILWRRSLSFDFEMSLSLFEMSLQHIYESILPSMLAIALLIFVIVPAPLGLVLITVPAIAPLSAYPGNTESTTPVDFTLADKVHDLYLAHPKGLLIALVVSAILLGLIVLIAKLSLLRRRGQAKGT